MLKFKNSHSILLMLVIGMLVVFSSCNTNKYLNDGEQYVATSKYKIKADEKIKSKNDLAYELSTLEKQKPNNKFLGITRMRLWQYYRLQTAQDTTKFNKWVEKVIAEQPSIMDSLQTVESAENMIISLKRRGYFDAEVAQEITRKKNTAYSTYDVDLKTLYTIDTTKLISKDTALVNLINKEFDKSFLKSGDAVSFENYQKERSRIRSILRNNGYAKFQINYLTRFRGDSTSTDKHKVKIEYDIITPTDSTLHQKYYIGDITVIPEFSTENALSINQDSLIKNYTFRTDGQPMKVKPSVLLENIFLSEGTLYRQRDQDETSLQLSNLGLYRFVTIKPIFSEDKPGIIDFEIYLTMNKKLALSIGAEVNNTNRTATATSLVGTALSFNWRNRNLFRGAELLLFNIEGGFELDPSSDSKKFVSNVNFSTEINLQIPRFNDYFGFWKVFGGKGKKDGSEGFYKKLVDHANSEFSTRFNYVDLNNAYTFRSFEVSYGVNINNLDGKTWNIDHIGIDYLLPTIDPVFETIAPEILKRSLIPQFLTGFLVPKEVTRKSVWRLSSKNVTKNFTWHAEHSGLEAHAFDIISGGDPLKIGSSILSKFLLGTVEFTRTKKINQGKSFAYKLFAGGVKSYGDAQIVPFVKQFNGGGANSSRGWRLFELGPGTYRDPGIDLSPNVNIIQTANLKLELNAEYRFDISGRFKSALFVDAGNIWTFGKEDERPGAEFEGLNSLKDLAISIGSGLRMDFTYFIFRVDVGFKYRTPYINYSGNNYTPFKDYLKRKNRFISIALGYPF